MFLYGASKAGNRRLQVSVFCVLQLLHAALDFFVLVIHIVQGSDHLHGVIFAQGRPYSGCQGQGFLLVFH